MSRIGDLCRIALVLGAGVAGLTGNWKDSAMLWACSTLVAIDHEMRAKAGKR